jgi:hypothetical protein
MKEHDKIQDKIREIEVGYKKLQELYFKFTRDRENKILNHKM